jgi:hypothetical protein
VGVISEDWPVWLEVLPSLGITSILARENGQEFINRCFAGTVPGLSITTSMERLLHSNLDLVFISGGPSFVRQKCSFCRDLSIVATSHARGNRLGELSLTTLVWTYVEHSEVGGVTDGKYWVGANLTRGRISSLKDPNIRVLGDIMSPMEGGPTLYNPPSRNKVPAGTNGASIMETLLTPRSRLPIARYAEPLAAPSLFSATGWVLRSLTLKELASAFDLSKDLQDAWTSTGPSWKCLRSTPSKVLMSCAESLVEMLEPLITDPLAAEAESDFNVLPLALRDLQLKMESGKAKAAKADDAAVAIHEWDETLIIQLPHLAQVTEDQLRSACDAARTLMLRWWRSNLRKEAAAYLDKEHGRCWRDATIMRTHRLREDHAVVADILGRSANATFWDWSGGSTLIFWRWSKDFRLRARDGVPVFISKKLPEYRKLQPKPGDDERAALVRDKLDKVRERKYIEPGVVVSLTSFFDVPKAGGSDIRLVYDASKCGLNDCVWAPNYFQASPDSLFNLLEPRTLMGDLDLGEFFLNFPLDHRIRPHAGVDLTPYYGQERAGLVWERWGRCLMGFKPSPYNTALSFGWAEEVIRGNPKDVTLPFQWDHVELNLPGSKNYNPSLPWLSKRRLDGLMACDFVTYCDDLRTLGATSALALAASARVASLSNFLGVQDAPRKRRFPDRIPGAWAGTVALTTEEGVFGSVTQERWDKSKTILEGMWEKVQHGDGIFNHKRLLSERGFLIYVTRAFPSMRPYLKGVHLTVDSWRLGRDEDGWKDPTWCGPPVESGEAEPEAPETVKAVNRLAWDLEALRILFSAGTPAVRTIRPSGVVSVIYGFGDASGSGFGSSFTHDNGVAYRVGVWGSDADGESSNYRELRNLVEAVEAEVKDGNFRDTELFLFTDNSTAEAVFYRGTSSNRKLFNLVLRLHRLEMTCGLVVHMIHVAGTRMKDQGTDGLSRGDLLEGVMKGNDFLSYIPIHLSACERSPKLAAWLEKVFGDRDSLELLSPNDWFKRGHDITGWERERPPGWSARSPGLWYPKLESGCYLWEPPPAAARFAVEELRKARLKRQVSTHIFVCPRLMAPSWRKQLSRVADVMFEIPAGSIEAWEADSHEPLVVGIVFPFLPFRPWQLRATPKFRTMGRQLCRVWKQGESDGRSLLWKFLLFARSLPTLPEGMVRRMLHPEDDGDLFHI